MAAVKKLWIGCGRAPDEKGRGEVDLRREDAIRKWRENVGRAGNLSIFGALFLSRLANSSA
jgi:hypothetical protein